jgi:SAM-dependent methyltransferase
MPFGDHINGTYFDHRLSPGLVAAFDRLDDQRKEVRSFAERLARLFNAAHIDATDVPMAVGRALHDVVPHILPGAWDGLVPSITYPCRHVRIDTYLEGNRWWEPRGRVRLLDLGCGFPPLTSVDTAERFPHWSVMALDRATWPYLVIDRSGARAIFDANRTLRYFQPLQAGPAAWRELVRDKKATRRHFSTLLDTLLTCVPAAGADALPAVEHDGVRLVLNPAREYERSNLSFAQGDLMSPHLPSTDVARCFNVLCYFDHAYRGRAITSVGRAVAEGGLFVTGVDWAETMLARYLVYRKEGAALVAREFAFTLDYLRASTTYFTLHDDDEESRQLVRAVAVLRRDREFFPHFSARHDALHALHGVCVRGNDGYLGDVPDIPGDELVRRNRAIVEALEAEGYVDRAVAALRRAGLDAWRNEAGHVAVTPEGTRQ